jgi:Flp pilus assembly pilin Flp
MWCERWRRRRRRESGAATLEYAGLLLLVGTVIAALLAVGIPVLVGGKTNAAVCAVFLGDGCQAPAGGTSTTGPGDGSSTATRPGQNGGTNGSPGNEDGSDWNSTYTGMNPAQAAWSGLGDQLGGFFSGLGNGIKDVATGIGGGIWDDVTGIGNLIAHPIESVKGLGWAVTHPAEAGRQLVWDDESEQEWDHGSKVKAVSRAVWNVGSWFIPGYDIGKIVSKVGKTGKVASEAGKLAKLARLSEEAEAAAARARRAADAGDLNGARRAAAEARGKADEAAEEARKNGCKLVSLGPPPTRRTPALLATAGTALALAGPLDTGGIALAPVDSPATGGIALAPAGSPATGRTTSSLAAPLNSGGTRAGRSVEAGEAGWSGRLVVTTAISRLPELPPPAVAAAPDPCSNYSAAQKARDQAAWDARRVDLDQQINDAVKNRRWADADNLADQAQREVDALPAHVKNDAQRAVDAQRAKIIDSKIQDAAQSTNKGTRLEAEAAQAVRPALRQFQREYKDAAGRTIGEADIETNKAFVEVAGGEKMDKGAQISRYVNDRTINPTGKPVIVFAPQWSAKQAQLAESAGAVAVVRNTAELKNLLRSMGEQIP